MDGRQIYEVIKKMTGKDLAPAAAPERRRPAKTEAPAEPTEGDAEPEPAAGPPPGDVEVAPAQRSAD